MFDASSAPFSPSSVAHSRRHALGQVYVTFAYSPQGLFFKHFLPFLFSFRTLDYALFSRVDQAVQRAFSAPLPRSRTLSLATLKVRTLSRFSFFLVLELIFLGFKRLKYALGQIATGKHE